MEVRPALAGGRHMAYRVAPPNPEAWLRRSEFLLSLYAETAKSVRGYFRLDAPTTDVEALLEKFEALYPIRRGGPKKRLYVARPAIAGQQMAAMYEVNFAPHPRGSHELDALKKHAEIMQQDLGLSDESEAARWLLTAETFALPWIEAVAIPNRFGLGLTLRIGTQDVQAEAVREAYRDVMRLELGGEHRGLSSDTIALALHDAEGRRRGETWDSRYKGWLACADEIGTTLYRVESWRAYRNQIVALKGRAVWIDEMLEDATKAGLGVAR
jgi:hypothetical protein